MAVALDANMLILLFDSRAAAPLDPSTGFSVSHCQDRPGHLLDVFGRPKGAKIVIPTPALGEFLVKVEPRLRPVYVDTIRRMRGCIIAPFSERAAIEPTDMQDVLLADFTPKRRQREAETRAKAKFDQQIVAIARCHRASSISSDDESLGRFATRFGIERIGVGQMPLPPKPLQGSLPLEPPEPAGTGTDDAP